MTTAKKLAPLPFAAVGLAVLCISGAAGVVGRSLLTPAAPSAAPMTETSPHGLTDAPAASIPPAAAQPEASTSQPAQDILPTGEHEGDEVRIVSMSGRDTDHASVKVEWPLDQAKLSCERGGDSSASCPVEAVRTAHFPGGTANCKTGAFTSVTGDVFQYVGRDPKTTSDSGNPEFIIRDSAGETLDGSAMSGYTGAIAVFQLLCPSHP